MIASNINLLIIEDNPGDVRVLEEIFKKIRDFYFNLDFCIRLSDGIKKLEKTEFDLILLDLSLPDSKKTETLSTLLDKNPNVPIVILTGLNDKREAIDSVRKGAQDYLIKGEINEAVLSRSILYAIERFKIEEKLKKSEEKYKYERDNLMNILASLMDGVIIINKQYDIEYANPILINEFGSIKGKKCYHYFFNFSDVCLTCEIFNVNTFKRQIFVEKNQKTFDFIGTPLRNPDGSLSKLGILHDITKLKQVEKKLKEINKLKSEFLNRASHELKTPLISIKGFSDLVLTLYKDELNVEIISKLEEINQGCERLQNIIDDLLQSSRLESSDLNPKLEREDLSFLIKYCVNELHSIARKREQSVNIDLPDSIIVRFEKEEIYNVISNLLINAIKYTPPKGGIHIKSEIIDDFVVFSIKDDGIGFTEEQKERIFQKFGKIERYGQGLDLKTDGTGLGLYISKKIVESHGGKIWMESEGRNMGSTFYFSLPYKKKRIQPTLII